MDFSALSVGVLYFFALGLFPSMWQNQFSMDKFLHWDH